MSRSTATRSSKVRISIPKTIRAELRWEVGQEFAFVPKGAGVLLIPVPELSQLVGIAKSSNHSSYRNRHDRY